MKNLFSFKITDTNQIDQQFMKKKFLFSVYFSLRIKQSSVGKLHAEVDSIDLWKNLTEENFKYPWPLPIISISFNLVFQIKS